MKKSSNFLAFIVFYSLFFLSAADSCAQCKQVTERHSAIFIDVTDDEHLELLREHIADEYKQLANYFSNIHSFEPCQQPIVRIYPINDKGENRPLTTTFEPFSSNMTETQIDRQIKPPFYGSLKKNIKAILNVQEEHSSELKNTRIYEPLCLLLNEYSNKKQPLTIIVYSDLLEHNKVSFYQNVGSIPVDKTLQSLGTNCHCTLPNDLSFVRLHLISFRTAENDRLIGTAREFWKSIFTARKAKVSTGTSLQNSFSQNSHGK